MIDIHVTPNSKIKTVYWSYDTFGKRLKLRISSPAVDGQANKQLTKIFSDLFGDIVIISGRLSRKKTIFVKDDDVERVSGILEDTLVS